MPKPSPDPDRSRTAALVIVIVRLVEPVKFNTHHRVRSSNSKLLFLRPFLCRNAKKIKVLQRAYYWLIVRDFVYLIYVIIAWLSMAGPQIKRVYVISLKID